MTGALKMWSIYKNHIRVFTTDPPDQWVEITDLCTTLFVNPIWFSGHRVYQFNVQVDSTGQGDEISFFEFKTTSNTQNNSVLKIQYQFNDEQLGYFLMNDPLKRFINDLTNTLTTVTEFLAARYSHATNYFVKIRQQINLLRFVLKYSQNLKYCLVLRLVYYEKPRIWIRSPGTFKKLTNSIADFVPIYSGNKK